MVGAQLRLGYYPVDYGIPQPAVRSGDNYGAFAPAGLGLVHVVSILRNVANLGIRDEKLHAD